MLESVPDERPGAHLRAEAARRRKARIQRGDGASPTMFERSFDKGGLGEELSGAAFDEEAETWGGFGVMHSIVLPEGGDIDHIVVGPAGVTVVDTKNWSGPAWVGQNVVGQGHFARGKPITGVQRQVARVRSLLATQADLGAVDVRGALCMIGGIRGGGTRSVKGIVVAGIRPVIDYSCAGGPMPIEVQERVFALLTERLHVLGGSTPPSPVLRPRPRAPQITMPQPRGPMPWLGRAALAAASAIAASAIVYVLLAQAGHALRPLSRHELDLRQPQYRALAQRRAHGRVEGPRVETGAAAFRLDYHARNGCRVFVTVSRGARLLGGQRPEVRSTGCRAGRRLSRRRAGRA